LLIRLMKDEALNSFFLVGGTALALQTGRRKKVESRINQMLRRPDRIFEQIKF